MPTVLLLDEFGQLVRDAFGEVPYHVGSTLASLMDRTSEAAHRDLVDVDVRVLLDDEEYAAHGFGDPDQPHRSRKWVALVRAFSALGREMTGLPIDFQIQQRTHANEKNDGPRSALFDHRLLRDYVAEEADSQLNEIGAVRGVTELEAQQKAEDHYGRNVVVQPWPDTPEEMR